MSVEIEVRSSGAEVAQAPAILEDYVREEMGATPYIKEMICGSRLWLDGVMMHFKGDDKFRSLLDGEVKSSSLKGSPERCRRIVLHGVLTRIRADDA